MRSKLSTSKNLITANMGKILYSRPILYIILAICLFQLFVFTSIGDYYSAAIFVLVGFLTSFFSKNMLVILVIALVITNILKYGTKVRQEGFDGDSETASSSDSSSDSSSSSFDNSNTSNSNISSDSSSDDSASMSTQSLTDVTKKPKTDVTKKPKIDVTKKPKTDESSSNSTPQVSESQLKRLETIMAQYKDLMFTQEQMTGNMAALTTGLTKAEGLISSISSMKQ